MQENNTYKTILGSVKRNLFIYLLVLISAGVAFYVGGLWTKVQMYEKGLISEIPGANNVEKNLAANGANPGTGTVAKKPDLAKPSDKDHVRGDANANIVLVEYSDFSCPFCRTFHETAVKALDSYKGKVKWVYRHFPLSQIHPNAQKQAEASECIAKLGGNTKFWEFADKMAATTTEVNVEELKKIAGAMGIDAAQFATCLDSNEMASIVSADYQSGIKAGVTGTPGNFLLNIKTGDIEQLKGAVPYEVVSAAIESLLKK